MTEIADVIEAFDLLGDWESRYQYLVELGERLEPMPELEMVEDNRVKQCMSTVFVAARPDPEHPTDLRFRGYCDTAIIKGVVALLIRLFSGKTPRMIVEMDVDQLFDSLSLGKHLSPRRHVGVYAIVDKMKAQASTFLH
jgi:cysteine desulfuration protein SufE